MNFGGLFQLKNSWAAFTRNHPKFPKFLQTAGAAITPDTIIEIETNLKVRQSDIELVKNLANSAK